MAGPSTTPARGAGAQSLGYAPAGPPAARFLPDQWLTAFNIMDIMFRYSAPNEHNQELARAQYLVHGA